MHASPTPSPPKQNKKPLPNNAGDDVSKDEDSTDNGEPMDAECKRESLTAADLEGLDVYDYDMYIEPACTEFTEHLPNGCNFMGLGQGCRGCYETCEGALYYIKMHKDEIDLKVGQKQALWGVGRTMLHQAV